MQPSKNCSNKAPNHVKVYVSEATLRAYLLLERRAFLQNVHADERLLDELEELESKALDDSADIKELIRSCVKIVRRNTEERRKALLQVVRNTEKRYGLKNKSRRNTK